MEKEHFTFSRKVLLLVFLFLLSSVANAVTFTVNNTADAGDTNLADNECHAVGFALAANVCTLRAAIEQANATAGIDNIDVPAGNYLIRAPGGMMMGGGGGGGAAPTPFTITEGVVINGIDGKTTTIISSNGNLIRTFNINSPTAVTISNVTIQNGNAPAAVNSGGVLLSNALLNMTFSNVTIRNSGSNVGAGLAWTTPVASVKIDNSTIEGNRGVGNGSHGGGINAGPGTLTITNSTIRNNTAVQGGGIYATGDVVLDKSTVSGNTANSGGFGGGGIFFDNTAGNLAVVDSTISGNMSLVSGAGLLVQSGTASLYSSTVSANVADSDNNGTGTGGGVTGPGTATGSILNIANTLIAGNISNTGVGVDCQSANLAINSAGFNLIGNNTDCTFNTENANDKINVDPVIGPLADNGGPTQTHRLLAGSPAIDAGNNVDGCMDNTGAVLMTDQRGYDRAINGGSGNPVCDIGAVELATVANAGPDQIVLVKAPVTLDGSASSAVAGIDTYSWTFVSSTDTTAAPIVLTGATTPTPSFTAPANPAVLVFRLTITSGSISVSDTVQVTVHQAPIANAGADQVVNYNDVVTLDGSASSDDGSIVDYKWSVLNGTAVAIGKDPTNPAKASFVAPEVGGAITIELTVTDNYGVTATDIVVINVNEPPVANAGADQLVTAGDTVTLTGAASTDDGGTANLTYAWVQVPANGGIVLTPSDTDPAAVTFTAPATAQTLTFQLTVTDAYGASSTDQVSVGVDEPVQNVNQPPVANAGRNQAVDPGMTVTLDGTGSTDSDGTIKSYNWTQTSGDTVDLDLTDPSKPKFTAPATIQTLTFELTVTDDKDATSAPDSVTIGVGQPVLGANIPPMADPGPDQTVAPGTLNVTLDGTASYDLDVGDTITYQWVQSSGEAVDLKNSDTATPSFDAPNADVTLQFDLTVTDNNGATSFPATVTITVGKGTNLPPIAVAGVVGNITVKPGDTVQLHGSDSFDPNVGDTIATYHWEQTAGTKVVFDPTNYAADPSFVAPNTNDTLKFDLVVVDSNDATSQVASVTIVVGTGAPANTNSGKPGSSPFFGGGGGNANSGGGGGGAMGLSVLLLALIALLRLWNQRGVNWFRASRRS